MTWDADDPERSKVTRQLAQEALSADQLRDDDFKAYLASASEVSDADVEESDVEGEARGERMRALLGLRGEEDVSPNKEFGKSNSLAFQDRRKAQEANGREEGEMEITFLPGLSEAAARKKKGEMPSEETTIEKYKRKQKEKRERRKKGPEEQESEAPVEEQGRASMGFEDPFFASDNDVDFDKALAAEQTSGGRDTVWKADEGKAQADAEARTEPRVDEGSDDDDDGVGHFSLKDIVKAEQAAQGGKKSRWAKKKEKKLAKKEQRGDVPRRQASNVQPGF